MDIIIPIKGYFCLDNKLLDKKTDELTQNYQEMDEIGKEKLLEETEKILELHKNGDDIDTV